MNDLNNIARYSGKGRRSPPPTLGTTKPIVPMSADKPVGRHSVIRTQLPNWQSYRSWVDKVRGTWKD